MSLYDEFIAKVKSEPDIVDNLTDEYQLCSNITCFRCVFDGGDSVLKNAPHTCEEICADEWEHDYARTKAAYPSSFSRERKFWPSVARVDSTYGDRNLVCACLPMEAYMES